MAVTLLVTGGARSGKSNFAEEQAREFGQQLGKSLVYIATAEAFDDEMIARISRHQDRRGPEWHTVHAPLDLAQAITQADGQGPCVVDCLTLWLSNLMMAEQEIEAAADALLTALASRSDPMILVTNEVGCGIVPKNALARRFRDEAGRLNQLIAQAVDEVYACISGIPVKIKPQQEQTNERLTKPG